jgi:hypothetical protein
MILRGAIFLAGVAITAFGTALAWAEILIATAGPMTGQYAWLPSRTKDFFNTLSQEPTLASPLSPIKYSDISRHE